MNDVQAFVKPYPQADLGGELGLNSVDIARSLGVRHDQIVQKLKRGRFEDVCKIGGWDFTVGTGKIRAAGGRQGRHMRPFIFDISAAKVFIARWDNEIGIGYMRYLLACERLAEHGMPALKAALADVQAKLAALMNKPKRIRGAERRHKVVAGFQTVTDLWGTTAKVPVYRELTRSQMTDEERRAFDAQHLAKISAGASQKAAQLINHEVEPSAPRVVQLLARAKKELAP